MVVLKTKKLLWTSEVLLFLIKFEFCVLHKYNFLKVKPYPKPTGY